MRCITETIQAKDKIFKKKQTFYFILYAYCLSQLLIIAVFIHKYFSEECHVLDTKEIDLCKNLCTRSAIKLTIEIFIYILQWNKISRAKKISLLLK